MRISDLLLSCVRSLLRRKVRTLLTVIGVVIGTCAILVTLSLGEGMTQAQLEMIEGWTDLTTIQVYQNWEGNSNSEVAQLNDSAVAGFRQLDHVTAVTPTMYLWEQAEIVSGRYAYQSSIRAIDLSMLDELGYELLEGSYTDGSEQNLIYFGEQSMFNFTDTLNPDKWIEYEYDDEGNIISDPPVEPMRDTFRYKLRLTEDSGGMYYPEMMEPEYTDEEQQALDDKRAQITAKNLQVGGVLKGDYAKDDGNTYYAIYIDMDFANRLIAEYNKLNGIRNVDEMGRELPITYEQVIVKADNMSQVSAIEKQIQEMGYSTYSFESQREPMEEQTRQIQLLFGGLGAISLLVAAIGIANTMVMSIYERTREIGVMKVLGCELRDIRWMFLIEAALIGLMGGVVGVGLSFVISTVINIVGDSALSIIPFWLVLLGLGFSTLVGILSGFSPANRAVRISALSAIRQE